MNFWLLIQLVFLFKLANGNPQSRIMGGKDATKPYPYQVSLQSAKLVFGDVVYKWGHYCGGSIITQRHVLSAAHCFFEDDNSRTQKNRMSILAGVQNLNETGTRYYPCSNVTHPKYPSGSYDIAIVTIKGEFTFVPNKVEPIKYTNEKSGAGISCVVTGWGSEGTDGKGPFPTQLQEIHLSTIGNKKCKSFGYAFITESLMCTLTREGEGICSGDSGGPLVDLNRHVLVGVANSVNGAGCGLGKPDVFTRVSSFYEWIQEHTKM